jgi:hypothetical protein
MLQRNWLTPFQVNQLFQGHASELVLDYYVLLERLGEGGMGTVFKARHRQLGRIVALKIIRKDRLKNPNALRRFEREIRAAALLEHPNVALTYDAREVEGTHFFAMEYVPGTDLAKLVATSGPLPIARACDCIRQTALGLQVAVHLVPRQVGGVEPDNTFFSVALSPDGRLALSGGQDGTVQLWETTTGKDLASFPHKEQVRGVAFSPDGKLALSAHGGEWLDGKFEKDRGAGICLWDVEKRQLRQRWAGLSEFVQCVAFSPDGRRALSGSDDRRIRLWDVQRGKVLAKGKSTKGVSAVAWSPDGRRALSGSGDGSVQLWNVSDDALKESAVLPGHTSGVTGLAISPDGKRLAAAGYEGRVILWREDAAGQVARQKEWQLPGLVRGMAFAPDGRHLAIGNGNGTIYILRLPPREAQP